MKNNFLIISILIIFNLFITQHSYSIETFNFNVTEVEIKDDGNKFIGKNKGIATTDDGMQIEADEFEYDKILNILKVKGSVKFNDEIKNIKIFSDKATYEKNIEKIFTKGNSKATDQDGVTISADEFEYNKNSDIIIAKGNVKIVDKIKDYIIFTDKISYLRKEEKIITSGKTQAIIESKYTFNSKNVLFLRDKLELISSNFSTIEDDKVNIYELDSFKYFLNDKLLKGENVKVVSNFSKEKSDKFNFKNIFTNFKNKFFTAGHTEILLHKNIFEKERKKFVDLENAKLNELFEDYHDENDPRLVGVSSSGNEKQTIINKGIFTSCNKNSKCPAWSIKSKKITHDKINQNIIYKDAVLNIYDFPVFYFPKFFHPDPSVERRSGFLKPELNESNILGSSFYLPYYSVLAVNKDLTIKPTIFDSEIYMLQNEYRQINENSSLVADFGLTRGYKSSIENSNKNSLSHLFVNFNAGLNIEKFTKSELKIGLEKTSNDTYLRLFQANIKSPLKPSSNSTLESGVRLDLDHEDYTLTTGMKSYENLSGKNSDRYQYIFPYYNFSKDIETNYRGSLSFTSDGANDLQNTNNLKTSITNNLNYNSQDIFTNFGLKNNFGTYFKNFNVVAKNDSKYKSKPQTALTGLFTFTSSLPLIKKDENNNFNTLTPKISFRVNPTTMKNYSADSRSINADNIFSINRLGISDDFESGRSVTLGIDYRKEDLSDFEKYFELKLATVLRDKFEKDIPTSSTLNRRGSNIFGSITNNFSENIKINYDFAIDNDFNTFERNSINTQFSINNFVTEFNFTETNGETGDENTIGNTTSIKIDDNNYFTFNTRRNRKTSLTEYYDLVYEYKNDCLTAGIKYKKTYYSDRDIKPSEDLFFTVTLFPLTTYEHKVNQDLYN